jgi:hypothetical protein
MPMQTQGSTRPEKDHPRDRTVADVAKEAFENRLIEGDRPAKPKPKPATDGSAINQGDDR